MGLLQHLKTPLPWYTERVWNYHEQKAADSALIAALVYAVLHGPMWQAALIAGLAYNTIGKMIGYFTGRVGWGTPLQETGDFIADSVTGQLATVFFAWPVVGLVPGAALLLAWCIAYGLLVWVARP